MRSLLFIGSVFLSSIGWCAGSAPELKDWDAVEPLASTKLLDWEGDLSLKLIEANDRFLDQQIEKAIRNRATHWAASPSISAQRDQLGIMLGLDRDQRVDDPEVAFWELADHDGFRVKKVKWRAFESVHGYGLVLEPKGKTLAEAIYIPDATEEDLIHPGSLAMAGCRVLIPSIVTRSLHPNFKLSNREWLHRPAFELGRTLTGYELHKILSAANWLKEERPLGIIGAGEGGRLALYASALDERFESVAVGGYFGPHDLLWQEPVDRNVFGMVSLFGNAEIARLIHPRKLSITNLGGTNYRYRSLDLLKTRPNQPGKPGVIRNFSLNEVKSEWERIPEKLRSNSTINKSIEGWLTDFAKGIGIELTTAHTNTTPIKIEPNRQIAELERHTEWVLTHSATERAPFWKNLDTRSVESFEKSTKPYREIFRTEVIGDFEEPRSGFNARSRPYQEGPKTVSYEVELDVMEGVFAYGILTIPKNIPEGKKLPVVVCQHGLEGSPQDVIGETKFKAYKAYATRLAEMGFVTFAPQNGYKYFDLFRMQQFKAQSIGKTLFSIIIPQHLQITDWLASLPFIDGNRIGFYGLSYGGKSAMRIPPLVERYSLSICSADFNDWVWKTAATDPASLRYSYTNKGEYEMFEWNLGGTFNYAEMAALIAPRPFMVERGHFDGVAPDERVALEFAKVRNLYQARLGIGDRCEIEWFVGPHSINGEGSYQFLQKHLGD